MSDCAEEVRRAGWDGVGPSWRPESSTGEGACAAGGLASLGVRKTDPTPPPHPGDQAAEARVPLPFTSCVRVGK